MNNFGDYAGYYDLLYRDKNYSAEVAFILDLIRKNKVDPCCVLELGCGTGGHAQYLAESGLSVQGIDSSTSMLKHAHARHRNLPKEIREKLAFSEGDIRHLHLAKTFEAVISLFHVMSYQTRNQDVHETFCTVKRHLQPGGIFVFDCWYGPAVLSELPRMRVKRWEDASTSVIRIAEPEVYLNDNKVTVNYTIFVTNKSDTSMKQFKEVHEMRYFFKPEIELFANLTGLEIIDVREWMTDSEPNFRSWNACFVARA